MEDGLVEVAVQPDDLLTDRRTQVFQQAVGRERCARFVDRGIAGIGIDSISSMIR
jgi:hypothetical protein